MNLSPKTYGLNARVQLHEISDDHIGIVKKVKSRIIQKDGLKIIDMYSSIKKNNPNLKVSLMCHDNICSKTRALLNDQDIDILIE